jgi:hypothetical protein
MCPAPGWLLAANAKIAREDRYGIRAERVTAGYTRGSSLGRSRLLHGRHRCRDCYLWNGLEYAIHPLTRRRPPRHEARGHLDRRSGLCEDRWLGPRQDTDVWCRPAITWQLRCTKASPTQLRSRSSHSLSSSTSYRRQPRLPHNTL